MKWHILHKWKITTSWKQFSSYYVIEIPPRVLKPLIRVHIFLFLFRCHITCSESNRNAEQSSDI